MTRADVIKTYFTNFNQYKKFNAYLRKEYPVNTKKTRYNENNKLCPTKKYLSK